MSPEPDPRDFPDPQWRLRGLLSEFEIALHDFEYRHDGILIGADLSLLYEVRRTAAELDGFLCTRRNSAHALTELSKIRYMLDTISLDMGGGLDTAQAVVSSLQTEVQHLRWSPISVTLEVLALARRSAGKPSIPSRRTRCALSLAVRVFPPEDRQRYREEFLSELADLPRVDQAPYAFRQLIRSWRTRKELDDRKARSRAELVRRWLMLATSLGAMFSMGATAEVILTATRSWPALLGSVIAMGGLAWTIASRVRTGNLARLIRAARGEPEKPKK